MSLGDYYDDASEGGGGSWLQAGEYEVTITGFDTGTNPHTGNQCVQFTVEDSGGRKSRATFWLTHKAMVILASFAKTCGLTRQECHAYDPEHPNSHAILVNRKVGVTVSPDERNSKYHHVTGWWKTGTRKTGPAPPSAQPANDRPPFDPGQVRPVSNDDIPF